MSLGGINLSVFLSGSLDTNFHVHHVCIGEYTLLRYFSVLVSFSLMVSVVLELLYISNIPWLFKPGLCFLWQHIFSRNRNGEVNLLVSKYGFHFWINERVPAPTVTSTSQPAERRREMGIHTLLFKCVTPK